MRALARQCTSKLAAQLLDGFQKVEPSAATWDMTDAAACENSALTHIKVGCLTDSFDPKESKNPRPSLTSPLFANLSF